MKRIAILLCFYPFRLSAQVSEDEAAIRNILQQQVVAWNNGNLDAFMQGYWKNDSLQFIGSNGPVYGYNKTLANYKAHYSTKAQMGHFTSTILRLQSLSNNYCYVTGKWHLERTVGNAEGYYTLLFKKIEGQWVIISDHSS